MGEEDEEEEEGEKRGKNDPAGRRNGNSQDKWNGKGRIKVIGKWDEEDW